MEISIFSLRLFIALLAGLVIGFERQCHHKNLDLKTNALVAFGAAIYVMLSLQMLQGESGDITRVVGQVIVGVGFLGAGVILHQGMEIHGLSTAATIWCSAAIGCLAGYGYFLETGICVVFIIFLNSLFLILDKRLKKR